eukprot:TRINITY_DN31156_c0_g1_i1.p1 TRINITY_DN31156_c0_g1~~TRINITY_DN31156_c0_g1_i1.p1  ORF type:complete len:547 (-),score=65.47 TRINITY_DN31156_c0_g1_i1:466-2106(-)
MRPLGSPRRRSFASQNLALLYLVLNGFAAVMQEDRGFYRSGGEYDLWRGAADDGAATIKWITEQEWSDGTVYSVGGSADGIAAALEVVERPKALKSEWLIWTTTDGHGFVYPGGALRLDLLLGYMDYMSSSSRNASESHVLPNLEEHEAYGPWWYNLTGCRSATDPNAYPPCRLDAVHWPVVLNVGWWDIFQITMLETWFKLRLASAKAVRDEHVLFVGPLGHCIAGISGTSLLETATLQVAEAESLVMGAFVASEFFNGTTRGPIRKQVGRVNIFVMGSFAAFGSHVPGNFWISENDFPQYTKMPIYLSSAGRLTQAPDQTQSATLFEYDPRDPTPMAGGNNLPDLPGPAGNDICGSANQDARDTRKDVLVFDSPALDGDSVVLGHITAHLFVSSSAEDTDFAVTLTDVGQNGTSMLVRQGLQRMRWRDGDTKRSAALEVGTIYSINVSMGSTAYIFPRGHKMRITVSSAAAPYFNPSSNTGVNDMIVNATPVVARNSIYSGGRKASFVSLPLASVSDLKVNDRWPCRNGICGEVPLSHAEAIVI